MGIGDSGEKHVGGEIPQKDRLLNIDFGQECDKQKVPDRWSANKMVSLARDQTAVSDEPAA